MFIDHVKSVRRGSFSAAAMLCVLSAASADVIYQNDFESGNAAGFTNNAITLAPNASTSFLGRFAGSQAPTGTVLSLSGLFAHEEITLSFDLYIIQSWDGNDGGNGPDSFRLMADSQTLVNATFSNWSPTQSYSDATPLGGGPFSAKTDADAENTLGYGDFFGTNLVYNMSFTFSHTDSSLSIAFDGLNLQSLSDESWGIDNVVVSAEPVPEPASMALVGLGLAAIMRKRRA